MFRKTVKLVCLLMLLVFSFVYTDKVFSTARSTDPVMVDVINYKEKNDIKPIEPIINDDELILGASGIIINAKKSYNNMKDIDEFDKEKIVYETKKPTNTISNTYKYYIKKGNSTKKQVSIIFKIDKNTNNLNNLLKYLAKYDVSCNFFVDGLWLSNNVNEAFDIVNYNHELYNLGYDGIYDKKMTSVTNNLIESISLKDSNFCLNDDKNNESKNICDKKKMHSILSTVIDPDITTLKENLTKGAIITYNVDYFDVSKLGLIVNTITSRGYEIKVLSSLIKE